MNIREKEEYKEMADTKYITTILRGALPPDHPFTEVAILSGAVSRPNEKEKFVGLAGYQIQAIGI